MNLKLRFIVLLLFVSSCYSQNTQSQLPAASQYPINKDANQPGKISAPSDANQVNKILSDLQSATSKLTSYQCDIQYNFDQPLLDSKTLRTGKLYYQKDKSSSRLRIDFETTTEDNEKPQKSREIIIFDGIWLTHIDYQTQHVKKIQQATPGSPIDAFELARQNFPIIGFTKVPELKKQFDITLIDQAKSEPNAVIQLLLKVKPDSIYKDQYTKITFSIDKKLSLPAEILATTVDSDIYDIKMLNPRLNKKLPSNIFQVKIPENFDIETTPLKQK
jgi:outer membrane lipoprotein-sorting protein